MGANLLTGGILWAAIACAAMADEPGSELFRMRLRAPGGGIATRTGTILVEAEDGSLLLAGDDQRWEIIPRDTVVDRVLVAAPREPESPRDLGRRILGELPPGFDLLVTKHYVVCFDTSRSYAQWAAAVFERLHEAFANFWERAGMEVTPPRQPLIVVIFSDRRRYEEHAAGDLGAATDRVVGYYNILSNRITTYDLTGSDALAATAGRSAGRAGVEILARPEAAGLVSTLVHEATHQMAFNCGLHQRLAPVPVWICEGVAAYFETPDVTSDRGWKAIGTVNAPRRQQFLATARTGWIEPLLVDDDQFRRPETAIDAYAQAWALTAFLVQTKKPAFVRYLQTLAAKKPLAEDSKELRREEFVATFGVPDAAFEQAVATFVARLRPEPRR
jgi:hypothetical protein